MLCLFRLSLTLNSQVGIPLAPSARLIKCWRDEGRGNQRNIRELETNMCTAGENGDVCAAFMCHHIIQDREGKTEGRKEKYIAATFLIRRQCQEAERSVCRFWPWVS